MTLSKNIQRIGKICDDHPELHGLRRNGSCVECERERSRLWAKNNRSNANARATAWFLANKEQHAANRKASYEGNKEQRLAKCKIWSEANPEKVMAAKKKYYEANKVKAKLAARVWKLANPEKVRALGQSYATANPDKLRANDARRKASKLRATPAWANHRYIALWYKVAVLEELRTGHKCHVDHIVPLRSKLVCGLHVEHNMQVMLGIDNLSKGNRHWPDMPSYTTQSYFK